MSSSKSRVRPHPPIEYPRLVPYAPVIQRSTDEVQVGVEPEAALIFSGAGFGALLALLDGTQPASAVRGAARTAGLSKPQLTWALDALVAAGLLTDRALGAVQGWIGAIAAAADRCGTGGQPDRPRARGQRSWDPLRLRRRTARSGPVPLSRCADLASGGVTLNPQQVGAPRSPA